MRRRRRARERQKKGKDRLPILKKLCAALLRSFRGQHDEKMKGSARGNWDPREGQQPFRPKRGRGPHHHVEAAVDWCRRDLFYELNKLSFFLGRAPTLVSATMFRVTTSFMTDFEINLLHHQCVRMNYITMENSVYDSVSNAICKQLPYKNIATVVKYFGVKSPAIYCSKIRI